MNESEDTPNNSLLLREHTDLVVIGDKGYISAAVTTALADTNRLHLLTIPRRNQTKQLPPDVARLLNAQRQIIETVHGQLTEQLGIELNHAHSFWGLCARLYTKLTAHTLSIDLIVINGRVQQRLSAKGKDDLTLSGYCPQRDPSAGLDLTHAR